MARKILFTAFALIALALGFLRFTAEPPATHTTVAVPATDVRHLNNPQPPAPPQKKHDLGCIIEQIELLEKLDPFASATDNYFLAAEFCEEQGD